MRYWRLVLLAVVCTTVASSCATMKGWVGVGESKKPAADTAEAPTAELVEAEAEDPETALRKVVTREIEAMDHASAADPNTLLHRRPYWLKEYVEYPENADNLQLEIQETESRTRPFIADVKVKKIRYSTRLHRARREPAADANFLRDTGTETLTYQNRNGRWIRVGSLFVADQTEEKVNDVWQPVLETPQRVEQEPEKPGILKSTWSWITGG